MIRSIVPVLLALGLGSAVASAQETRPWTVVPSFGVMRYDRTTALSSPKAWLSKLWPSVGLSTDYAVRPNLKVGLYLEGGSAKTNSEYFPPVRLQYGPSFTIDTVSQQVFVLSYGVSAAVDLPVARRIGPYVRGGLGRHTLFPDVQRSNSASSVSGTHVMLGAGLAYTLSGSVGLRMELLDFMWIDFDRDRIDPGAGSHATGLDPQAASWEKPGLVHNMRFAVGVTFVPGRAP